MKELMDAVAALSTAATNVNDRYIGGSPLNGRLGEALDQLAQANVKVARLLRGQTALVNQRPAQD
jgi:hypothetical protein